jgi:hypothetical protein
MPRLTGIVILFMMWIITLLVLFDVHQSLALQAYEGLIRRSPDLIRGIISLKYSPFELVPPRDFESLTSDLFILIVESFVFRHVNLFIYARNQWILRRILGKNVVQGNCTLSICLRCLASARPTSPARNNLSTVAHFYSNSPLVLPLVLLYNTKQNDNIA